MLGQGEMYPFPFDLEAAIAASQTGPGGTGGGPEQGQPESVTFPADGKPGLLQVIKDAAGRVLTTVEAPFKAAGGLLQGVQTVGEYLPLILFGLGAVALFVVLPKGGRR